MTYGTMEKIETVTVGSGGAANIEFTNIPQTYNDLKIVMSLRVVSGTDGTLTPSFNGSTANFSYRRLIGDGANASSFGDTTNNIGFLERSDFTANTFSNAEMYIPNYTSSTNKSFYVDSVTENNATTAFAGMWAALWSNTAAITSVRLSGVVNLAQHSTATLYGITRVPAGAKATGGVITDDATHWYHTFTSSGVFTPSQNLTCDYLVVAGGGAGNSNGRFSGGGGAGGLIYKTAVSVTALTNNTVTVGAGGAVSTVEATLKGSNSVFLTDTAIGGGGAGAADSLNGFSGGSGGGGGSNVPSSGTGGAATSGQGNNGGNGNGTYRTGGGGGGAGAVGSNAGIAGGNGGNGATYFDSTYAGGGGGSAYENGDGVGEAGNGGTGGGGRGGRYRTGAGTASYNATPGSINTGGGGGGGAWQNTGSNNAAGGSGIVIVRYAK